MQTKVIKTASPSKSPKGPNGHDPAQLEVDASYQVFEGTTCNLKEPLLSTKHRLLEHCGPSASCIFSRFMSLSILLIHQISHGCSFTAKKSPCCCMKDPKQLKANELNQFQMEDKHYIGKKIIVLKI